MSFFLESCTYGMSSWNRAEINSLSGFIKFGILLDIFLFTHAQISRLNILSKKVTGAVLVPLEAAILLHAIVVDLKQ